jgi:D-glycero-alpha-D-manno-heptose 1-phosphate guanylyltransferase
MIAIILAGGFGTRIADIAGSTPKAMLEFNGKVFISYMIDKLIKSGFNQFIFALHYNPNSIIEYFTSNEIITYHHLIESKPLGTGGAILNAINWAKDNLEHQNFYYIFNADNFIDIDHNKLIKHHINSNKKATLVITKTNNVAQYGKVIIKDDEIIGFAEKISAKEGYISSGHYIFNHNIFANFQLNEVFSIEYDFFAPNIPQIKPSYFINNNFFIDIGTKDDYEQAQINMPSFITN